MFSGNPSSSQSLLRVGNNFVGRNTCFVGRRTANSIRFAQPSIALIQRQSLSIGTAKFSRRLPKRTSKPRTSIQMSALFGLESLMGATLLGTLGVDMGIQWVGWAIAAALQTEKFYDLFGSFTFISLSIGTLVANGTYAPRQVMVTGMIVAWALRLGSYLVARIKRDGSDSRFDDAKKNPGVFFVYWSLQGVWVFLTALPLFILNGKTGHPGLSPLDFVGLVVWAIGLGCEAVADSQKWEFRNNPANKGRFIRTGLWKYSRHPNYFGEILVWWGVFLTSATSLTSWQIAAGLASPVFVMTLLMFVSGVPMLEASADEKWGSDPEYQEYKAQSRVLLPFPRSNVV